MSTINQEQLFFQNLAASNTGKETHTLYASYFETPLGPMVAVSDEQQLYLLEFIDTKKLTPKIAKLKKATQAAIIAGSTNPIHSIKQELTEYFAGTLTQFKTPINFGGSLFQNRAWQALNTIPYGHTRSYLEQATVTGNAKAFRAVANANGANQLAIIIPCHRIINNNGKLGGYGGGVTKKQWLLDHEKNNLKKAL